MSGANKILLVMDKLVTIKLLGILKNSIGKDEIVLDLNNDNYSLSDILRLLKEKYKELSIAIDESNKLKPGFIAFINDIDYMALNREKTRIRNNDTVTLMPISHGGI